MTKTLFLIRHAQCVANELNLVCGIDDSPLSEGGKIALSETGRIYIPNECLLISSPLTRCLDTSISLFGKEPAISEKLLEVDYGFLEGRNKFEVADDLAEFGINWEKLCSLEFSDYEENAAWLLSRSFEYCVAVTHGGYINFVVAQALGIAARDFPFMEIANLNVVGISHRGAAGWNLLFANRDVSCLNEFIG